MPHPLTLDPVTGKLSRLKAKDLSLIGIDGLNDGDPIAPFGTLTTNNRKNFEHYSNYSTLPKYDNGRKRLFDKFSFRIF